MKEHRGFLGETCRIAPSNPEIRFELGAFFSSRKKPSKHLFGQSFLQVTITHSGHLSHAFRRRRKLDPLLRRIPHHELNKRMLACDSDSQRNFRRDPLHKAEAETLGRLSKMNQVKLPGPS